MSNWMNAKRNSIQEQFEDIMLSYTPDTVEWIKTNIHGVLEMTIYSIMFTK